MDHPLQCRCGAVAGSVASPHVGVRVVCYCLDCQAYARFLDPQAPPLGANSGTEVVATQPRHVRFASGLERLQCMSLSERGLLRWYAGCCRTPLANTPRDPKLPYVGLARPCLGADDAVERAFGPLRCAVNTKTARPGPVAPTPFGTAAALARILSHVGADRLTGRWRQTPFFDAGGRPVRRPQVLSGSERRALEAA
jgi:hypothetical protein